MRYLLCLLLFLPACGAVREVQQVAARANAILEDARSFYADAKQTYEQAKAAADTDQSGDTTVEEWIAYLLGAAGLGGGAILTRNARSNARKDVMEARIASLESNKG